MSTTSELREKSVDALKMELLELLKEQFNLRMQKGTETSRTHRFKFVRRDIARIKTILKEKGRNQ